MFAHLMEFLYNVCKEKILSREFTWEHPGHLSRADQFFFQKLQKTKQAQALFEQEKRQTAKRSP